MSTRGDDVQVLADASESTGLATSVAHTSLAPPPPTATTATMGRSRLVADAVDIDGDGDRGCGPGLERAQGSPGQQVLAQPGDHEGDDDAGDDARDGQQEVLHARQCRAECSLAGRGTARRSEGRNHGRR